jgi:hypothetical protein
LENDVNELRSKLQSLKIETQNNLLVSNSLLQFHQKELEELKTSLKKNEKEKELHDDKAKNVARETSQVIQSIKNVYFRCQSTMRNKSQLIVNANAGGGGGGGGGGSNNPTLLPSSVTAAVGTTSGGGGTTSGGGTGTTSSSGNSSIAHLSELLSLYLDIIHSRVSDLIEISNEYKVFHANSNSGSLYSINAPSQLFTAPSGTASMNLDAVGFPSGGGGGVGTGVSGANSQFDRDRNVMSKSAPSGQLKGGGGVTGGKKSQRR